LCDALPTPTLLGFIPFAKVRTGLPTVWSPLKLKGATGSPGNPVALY
jgi:hypothetical protein